MGPFHKFVSRSVRVRRHNGTTVAGILWNVGRHTLWLVEGAADVFVNVGDVAAIEVVNE